MNQNLLVRHQVAIAGRVVDGQTSKGLGQARVQIIEGPESFAQALVYKPDLAVQSTRMDGHFHFLNLPDGRYALSISLPRRETRYATQTTSGLSVSSTQDGHGRKILWQQQQYRTIALQPTTVKGRVTTDEVITDADGNEEVRVAPVAFAEVRVVGSGEKAYSDGDGNYELIGLEASLRRDSGDPDATAHARTLVFSAYGLKTHREQVALNIPGVERTVNVHLLSATQT